MERDDDRRLARGLLATMTAVRGHLDARVAEFELSPAQATVLRLLDAPSPMRRLAARLGCDASNVTGIVDRLEARGLVQRLTDPSDRRVRHLALTPAGARVRADLDERLLSDLPGVDALGADDRRALADLLDRLLVAAGA